MKYLAGNRWLALLLMVGACERSDPKATVPPTRENPNVVLITLDTTRADRLGCYGYPAARTPTLDRLAAEGVRFERAFAQVPLTLPSHASLLTGLYPPECGIRINGTGALPDDIPTLASAFEAAGYRTGAFVAASVLNRSFGLNRGFGHYDDDLESDGRHTVAERSADRVCDAAMAWLQADPERRFFAWVHFFDPHHPYEPPPAYREALADPYDGEIAFVDSQIGRLVDWLSEQGLRERTLIVVTADHGEAFGEHEETQHGLFVYGPTMHVPLMVAMPSRLHSGATVTAITRLVDLAPSLVDLAGLGVSWEFSGESFAPALQDPRSGKAQDAYGETRYPRLGFGWAPLTSLTSDRWKYIQAPNPELYDLQSDPGETENLVDRQPEIAHRLRTQLDETVGRMTIRTAPAATLDASSWQQLKSLGYVGGSADDDERNDAQRRDPKDMVAVYRGLMRARAALQAGHHADVVSLLEPLTKLSPESDALHSPLGAAYLQLGRYDEARAAYERSLRSVPDDPENLCGLGDALRQLGRSDDAIACYEAALAAWPTYGQAHSRLGISYAEQGRHQAAYEHFRRFAELSPSSPNAHTNLANASMAIRRPQDAVDQLRKALALDPAYRPAHSLLWRALFATGRKSEGVTALRNACELIPDDVDLRVRLAWVLAVDPQASTDSADAVRLAEAAARARSDDPVVWDVLGAAYAAASDFKKAISSAQRAFDLATTAGNGALADQIQRRLQLYRQGRPYRE